MLQVGGDNWERMERGEGPGPGGPGFGNFNGSPFSGFEGSNIRWEYNSTDGGPSVEEILGSFFGGGRGGPQGGFGSRVRLGFTNDAD